MPARRANINVVENRSVLLFFTTSLADENKKNTHTLQTLTKLLLFTDTSKQKIKQITQKQIKLTIAAASTLNTWKNEYIDRVTYLFV